MVKKKKKMKSMWIPKLGVGPFENSSIKKLFQIYKHTNCFRFLISITFFQKFKIIIK